MTKQTWRKFSPEFKAKVALEAEKNQLTLAELSKKFEVSPIVISRWKSEFLANIAAAFQTRPEPDGEKVDIEKLYAQIGQLEVENDFLKKNCKKLGIWVHELLWLDIIHPSYQFAGSVHYWMSIGTFYTTILFLNDQRMSRWCGWWMNICFTIQPKVYGQWYITYEGVSNWAKTYPEAFQSHGKGNDLSS